MKYSSRTIINKLASSILALAFLVLINLVWLGRSLTSIPAAKADTSTYQQSQLVANSDTVQDLKQKTKKTIDKTMGSGTSDRLEGKIEEAAGRVQQKTGEITDQVEGAMKRAKGKAKQDIGKVKGAAEKASSEVEETSQGVLEQVKDFFGQ